MMKMYWGELVNPDQEYLDKIGNDWRGVVNIDDEWWSFRLHDKHLVSFLSNQVRDLKKDEVINLQRAPSLPVLQFKVTGGTMMD